MSPELELRPWMKPLVTAFAASHALLGLVMVTSPLRVLSTLFSGETDAALLLAQLLGGILFVGGFAVLLISRTLRNQELFLSAIGLSLIVGFVVFTSAVVGGQQPRTALSIGAVWCIAWAIPLSNIVWALIRKAHLAGSAFVEPEADDPLLELRTNKGRTLDQLADEKPQMVVFLRHAGCTFCRQTLSDIRDVRTEIEATGCGIVFVHLGREDDYRSVEVFQRYGVADLPRISDPTSRMYRQFGLDLGGFAQLFGLRVWLRGLKFGLVNGHGIGAIRGNSLQMPGVYLYHCGIILGGFRHERVSDQLDYVALARQVALRKTQPAERTLSESLV